MITGTTKSGFNYSIKKEALNDYELMEDLGEIDNNPIIITKIITNLLGEEQKTALKDHVRIKTGHVPIDKLTDEILEIFHSQEEIKKF